MLQIYFQKIMIFIILQFFRYTSPPGVGAESSTSSSTLSQKMENSSTSGMTTSGSGIATGCGDAPREARPARFQVGGPGIEPDCNLLAETPLVSASQFAASLGNLTGSASSR